MPLIPRRFMIIAVLAPLLMLPLSGCTATAPAAEEAISVGYSGASLVDPFSLRLSQGINEGTRELGLRLTETNAGGDPDRQVIDAGNLLEEKIDVLILNPIDGATAAAVIALAHDTKVKVFTVGADRFAGDIVSSVRSESSAVGRRAAAWATQELIAKHGRAEGRVVSLASSDLAVGFADGLRSSPDVSLIGLPTVTSEEDAYLAVLEQLYSATAVDVIFGTTDDLVAGAVRAVDEFTRRGLPGASIVRVGTTPEGLEALGAGDVDAAVTRDPAGLARFALTLVQRKFAGETIARDYAFPTRLVTRP